MDSHGLIDVGDCFRVPGCDGRAFACGDILQDTLFASGWR
jgi:hypothetical protein